MFCLYCICTEMRCCAQSVAQMGRVKECSDAIEFLSLEIACVQICVRVQFGLPVFRCLLTFFVTVTVTQCMSRSDADCSDVQTVFPSLCNGLAGMTGDASRSPGPAFPLPPPISAISLSAPHCCFLLPLQS